MSKTEKEMREEFERDLRSGKFDHPYNIESIKPHGIELKHNKYQRHCKGVYIDVYDVLKAFSVTNPATQHAIKKLLAGGKRGHKDLLQDLNEANDSISRAIDLELEDEKTRD